MEKLVSSLHVRVVLLKKNTVLSASFAHFKQTNKQTKTYLLFPWVRTMFPMLTDNSCANSVILLNLLLSKYVQQVSAYP